MPKHTWNMSRIDFCNMPHLQKKINHSVSPNIHHMHNFNFVCWLSQN